MDAKRPDEVELAEAWADETARWRSGTAYRGEASGAFLLELAPGARLERHTDSAEEAIVVVEGRATVVVGEEERELGPGGVARVPREAPHEVRNAGATPLRFVGVYASADVVTTYVRAIQPDGSAERRPLG
jgi:mannose-6-phosphate isomerase-like protein (cupin superfamily)